MRGRGSGRNGKGRTSKEEVLRRGLRGPRETLYENFVGPEDEVLGKD